MIRVILQGRTGNNLFQYAAGRALAKAWGQELILDGSWMDGWHAGHFEQIRRLPLQACYERKHTLAKRLGRKLLGVGPATWHPEKLVDEFAGDRMPSPEVCSDGRVLNGFFQHAFHLASIEAELRKEIDLSVISIPDESLKFEEALKQKSCVSVHVRRGDYLKISSTNCIGNDYHEQAIQWFRQRHKNLRFCVFSDDIAWCRQHFTGPEFLFCDLPASAGDPLHDLRLMTACHDHIVVNSSYSWWGAWLNPAPDKVVLAPAQWMAGLSSLKIVPPEWITL
jgi:hypothetical protein